MSTIGLFVLVVIQFILSWAEATKRGKSFRSTVLVSALMAAGASVILAREFFGALPLWIDASLAILVSLIILLVLGLGLVQLKRYLKSAW